MAEVNVPPTPTIEEFNATGRTGRRNAMADILDSKHASVSTADLPFGMENLSCSDDVFYVWRFYFCFTNEWAEIMKMYKIYPEECEVPLRHYQRHEPRTRGTRFAFISNGCLLYESMGKTDVQFSSSHPSKLI
ncbi:hypothetical protein FSP39_016620 [Pinctada imbricata]|uniref:Uncharacterized protein n=1 Tax=Pinctada imbricata TaxID=66713 RepID=A0AA88XV14_PINIB|nr:hypothetical protein FSP39_016620 [Pinctada imbricata]